MTNWWWWLFQVIVSSCFSFFFPLLFSFLYLYWACSTLLSLPCPTWLVGSMNQRIALAPCRRREEHDCQLWNLTQRVFLFYYLLVLSCLVHCLLVSNIICNSCCVPKSGFSIKAISGGWATSRWNERSPMVHLFMHVPLVVAQCKGIPSPNILLPNFRCFGFQFTAMYSMLIIIKSIMV